MDGTEKVYCLDNGNSAAETMALMNNNNNSWNNNPFVYLVWMMMMRYMNGNGWGNDTQSAELMSRLNLMLTQMSDSFNSLNTNGIISSNHDAINTGFSTVNAGIANAVNNDTINTKDLQSTFQSCCCQNQMETQKMGYENQISNLNQTNSLLSAIENARQATVNGFANLGYTTAQQTCELKTNQNDNTQRIIDTMTTHWQAETSQALQDAKFEISQLKQNQYLINSLGGGCSCNS